MAAIFENLLGGVISDDPLTSGATTINSSGLQHMPEVVAPAFMYVTLDPSGANGLPEIVKVTAHTASATSATVERAQQDTAAREHPTSTAWVHALTEADVDGLGAPAGTDDIADLAVTTAKLAADAVDGSKLADDAVDSEHYANGSIDTAHLADGAVTPAKVTFGWQTDWTPTFQANVYGVPTVGSGTWDAKYLRIGNVGWISAVFTTAADTNVSVRSTDIDLPPGWTATGPAFGYMTVNDPGDATVYPCLLAVGDGALGEGHAQESTNTKVSSSRETGATFFEAGSGYAQGVGVSEAGVKLAYSIGPIPLA